MDCELNSYVDVGINGYVIDKNSGYYFNSKTNLFFDPNTGYYYSVEKGAWMILDTKTGLYKELNENGEIVEEIVKPIMGSTAK